MTVSHLNPYDQAFLYRNNFWLGPLPLPYKKKDPPPTGFTGHNAAYPNIDEIKQWLNEGQRNICLRLAGVDEEHEIIGIDVDHYRKGDRDKRGGDQLKALEDKLGKLPDTWISSSRFDGISGIRYYRVPRGMAFRGQVDKDIECISKGYRYAIVFPSIHDETGEVYWWFPPGVRPDNEGRLLWEGGLPDARSLECLPQVWLGHLTQGGMRATDQRIDMDSELDDIYLWVDNTFHGDDDTEPCPLMREKIEHHKKKITEEATSHDKITNFHWNIAKLASEGHLGFTQAINELEQCFIQEMIDRNKRGDELYGEIFRSRAQALRKVKGDCDERVKIGAAPIDARCDKMGGLCCTDAPQSDPDDPLGDIPTGSGLGLTGNYEMNDDGNAAHFVDYFCSAEIGPSVRYAEGRGWLIWHSGENPHWEVDENGDQSMRRMWQKVKIRQQQYVDALWADYEQQFKQWNFNGPLPPNVKAAKALHDKWKRFTELSGNNRNANNAIEAVKSINQVSINVNKLDSNPYLLGVANGIIELDNENVRLRKSIATDYVTLNTGVPYERPTNLASQTWQEYLDTFLPDRELQRCTQVALGHALVGGNPEKIMIVLKGDPNTGKSTMVTALQTALGDYAESVNQSIFQNHKLNPILADAITKRVIVCSEFDEEDRLSASMVKRLTGGHDEIRAEKKGSNAKFAGIPQFVPVLATNEVPQISGADKALQNRLFVIPFNVTPKRVNKKFANVIKAICGAAILNWLIEGFIEYRRIGELPLSDAITRETEFFVAELDPVATFASECLKRFENEEVSRERMFRHFLAWCDSEKLPINTRPTKGILTRRLKALGWKSTDKTFRIDGGVDRKFLNVRLQDQPHMADVVNLRKMQHKLGKTD